MCLVCSVLDPALNPSTLWGTLRAELGRWQQSERCRVILQRVVLIQIISIPVQIVLKFENNCLLMHPPFRTDR